MIIYLIGVHHSIQHDGGDLGNIPGLAALREQFRYYLMKTLEELGVSVLAEELNEDALAIFNTPESLARSIAGKSGVSHVFCEPSWEMRKSLGFTGKLQRKHHVIRELFWYNKIVDYKGERIIFICGANHIPSFTALIRKKGQHAIVLTPYYGQGFFSNFDYHLDCERCGLRESHADIAKYHPNQRTDLH
uniref:Uncharacterized protein n=1 Tax=Candidatus Kentrum sp. FW TaxID=2126338 RepID=A0A450SL44_9GAMM|nr:MAG: hypothetical protein BECKFW1821A_GA0114235_10472 [Candidatus Kentron sp. FW]